MGKRIAAATTTLIVWVLLVWFTVWDRLPSQWEPDQRFGVAMIGIALTALAAVCPIFDED